MIFTALLRPAHATGCRRARTLGGRGGRPATLRALVACPELLLLLLVLLFLVGTLLAATGCRPDPYALFLRTLTPGEPVDLPGGRTLTFEAVDGRTLTGVRLEGPAETCDGTMVLEAPEARLEPVVGTEGGAGRRLRVVLEQPKAVERCGSLESVTTQERMTVTLDLDL